MLNQEFIELLYESDFILPYLKQFKKYLKENAKILDYECNIGVNSLKMSMLNLDVVGCDSSLDNLDIAKKYNKNIEFIHHNIKDSLNELGIFDGIIINDCFNDLEINDVSKILNNIKEILKGEGYILLIAKEHDANKFSLIKSIMENNFIFIEELTSDNVWNFFIYKKKHY